MRNRRIRWWFLILVSVSLPLGGSAKAPLGFQATYQQGSSVLTTEKVWEIDRGLKNPHRQMWALERKTELIGIEAIARKDQLMGAQAQGLKSDVKGYVRGVGQGSMGWEQFSCESAPDSAFSQPEGSQVAAEKSAQLWSQLLKENLVQLDILLGRIQAKTAAQAVTQAEEVFQSWLQTQEGVWREKNISVAREAEWKSYLEKAQSFGHCPRAKSNSVTSPSVPQMEPPLGVPPQVSQMLVRAPARLWNGRFSVRLNIKFAGRKLNGRFLIDSNAPRSIVSPSWLDAQGIFAPWVKVPRASLEKVRWGGEWSGEQPLAPLVRADQVDMSGLKIPLSDFLLAETEFFDRPQNLGSCCDGVLGSDFLRLFPMEFRTASPPEVRVWPRQGFSWGEDHLWIELSQNSEGDLQSACHLRKKTGEKVIQGVNWALGAQSTLRVHEPHVGKVERLKDLNLICGSIPVVSELRAERKESAPEDRDVSVYRQSDPAMSVGMNLLNQTQFTLDLPHGRIWFPKSSLPLKPLKNVSGLNLKVEEQKGERILRVASVSPSSPAKAWGKLGLKPGAVITEVDSHPAEDLDLWDVHQRLSGVYSKQVLLKWKHGKKIQSGLLQLSSEKEDEKSS